MIFDVHIVYTYVVHLCVLLLRVASSVRCWALFQIVLVLLPQARPGGEPCITYAIQYQYHVLQL